MPAALPKILIYSAPFYPLMGGMERYAEDLASGLTELGCQIQLATRTPAGPQSDAERFSFPVRRISGYDALARAMLISDLTLFVGFTFFDVMLGALLLRRMILTHHGPYSPADDTRRFSAGAVKRWLCRFFRNISVSHNLASRLAGEHLVIHNCYRDDLFRKGANSRPEGSFVFVGRLVSDKGVHLLINSFARVHDERPRVRLTIVGDGPERDALTELAASLKCRDAVTFAGCQPAEMVAQIVAAHQCQVVPSIGNESFGIAALEGLAAGCEVIVTRQGGLPEAVGAFGWIVETSVDGLCTAMKAVLAGESRRLEPGISEYLQEHARLAVAGKYADAITRALRCPVRPASMA
jgi:glycosyltransferase involved in cell wall biosynthesis